MELVVLLGIVLVCGYFFGLVAERLGFPRVTAYLLAGVLFSEDFLGSKYQLNLEIWSDLFSQICLGFIAYIVGSEIHLKKIFEHKKATVLATLLSSFLPILFVYVGFYLISLGINTPIY
jgi:Kef-type K+ transport system membrane component KefB